MKLFDGLEKQDYSVKSINLRAGINKRLEALGMIPGTKLNIINKNKTAVIIMIRGTRLAVGKTAAQNIEIMREMREKGGFL